MLQEFTVTRRIVQTNSLPWLSNQNFPKLTNYIPRVFKNFHGPPTFSRTFKAWNLQLLNSSIFKEFRGPRDQLCVVLHGDGFRCGVRPGHPGQRTCLQPHPWRSARECGRAGTRAWGGASWSCCSYTRDAAAATDSHWQCGWRRGQSVIACPSHHASLPPAAWRPPSCTFCHPVHTTTCSNTSSSSSSLLRAYTVKYQH